jgi:hypothetical protein
MKDIEDYMRIINQDFFLIAFLECVSVGFKRTKLQLISSLFFFNTYRILMFEIMYEI